ELQTVEILQRERLNHRLSLVLVHALAPDPGPHYLEERLRSEVFGLFVVDRESARREWTVDIFPTEAYFDFLVKIEKAGETSATISKKEATYGWDYGKVKYYYDLPERIL
ncbi:MAG: hypothetical protein ACE5JX_22285, partial [Acidobacteriota bacterium]